MSWKTMAMVGAAGAGILYAGRKLVLLNDLSNKVVVTPSPRIERIDWGKLQIVFAADVTISNPSTGTVKVSHPVVSLFDSEQAVRKNEPLIVSTLLQKTYQLPKQSEIKLDPILMPVSATSLVDIGARILSGQSFTLFLQKATRVAGVYNMVEVTPYTFFKDKTTQADQPISGLSVPALYPALYSDGYIPAHRLYSY